MMYLLSVGANLILKHFAIKRFNEKVKNDNEKIKRRIKCGLDIRRGIRGAKNIKRYD